MEKDEEINPTENQDSTLEESVTTVPISPEISSGSPNYNVTVKSVRAYDICVPEEDYNDFVVEIRASQLEKARQKIIELGEKRWPIREFLLAVATTSLGATLSYLSAGNYQDGDLYKLFFIFCPIVTTLTGTLYFVYDPIKINLTDISKQLLQYIPDPKTSKIKK